MHYYIDAIVTDAGIFWLLHGKLNVDRIPPLGVYDCGDLLGSINLNL